MADAASEVEELLFAALELTAAGDARALDELLAQHPAHAAAVRSRLDRLARLGLASQSGAAAGGPPERLGDFRLLAKLGEGGMGVVYSAEQTSLKRTVAIKLVRPELLWFAGARERFQREVEAVARLQHPGIVPVLAVGEESGVPYFAMERFDGATLAETLARVEVRDPDALAGSDLARALALAAPGDPPRGALFEGSWDDACFRIARQVAEALEHAHSRGVVHRDVKPSNVALTRAGRAMLFDFGLARREDDPRLTRSGVQPGSLAYMSPEQVEGASAIDARSDVYSLGVTLYEMLTLHTAFASGSSEALRAQVLAGDVRRPRTLRRRLARDAESVCTTAMARATAARYASADDLARDLGHLLARRPIEARRPGWRLRAVRWAQRNPRASAALLAALPIAVAALALLAWRERRGRRAESELRARAEAQRAEILRLADARRVADLAREADTLFPALPARVESYRSWLARAGELTERLALHRATIDALRRREGARELDDGAWDFESDEAQWQHDTLAALIGDIAALAQPARGLVADVERRLAFASTIEQRSRASDDAAMRWREAIAAIADRERCPPYAGLEIAPQLGLLPIGLDPASRLVEFAHLATGEPAVRGGDGELEISESTGLVLVLVPGGRFQMGSRADEPAAWEEGPPHEIALDPFFLSKFEMTQAQWLRATGANPSAFAPGFATERTTLLHPVESVTWEDCSVWMARLALALPTEAQWERAARAGTATRWWTGDDVESTRGAGNVADLYYRAHGGPPDIQYEEWLDDGRGVHASIGTYRANPFGLHDVIGNVFEWCRDWLGPYALPVDVGDGLRRVEASPLRAMRGGSFENLASQARAAARTGAPPHYRAYLLGVRPARALDGD